MASCRLDDGMIKHASPLGFSLFEFLSRPIKTVGFRSHTIDNGSDADGDLDLKADVKVVVTSPLLDLSGDLEVNGGDILRGSAANFNIGSDVGANQIVLGGASTLTVTAGDLVVNGNDTRRHSCRWRVA